jgi:hypothetical protein
MERFWDLRRTHRKTWYGAWALTAVAVVTVAQWQLSGGDPILTQVLGAQAKKPDVTPPSVSVSFPANNGVYGPATWTGSVSGAAADATGVAKVEVQLGTGPWLTASGTTNWTSPLTLPADEGSYAVSVQATDSVTPVSAANTSSPVTVTFKVDRTAPPAPVITARPDNPSFDTKPRFAYSDSEAGVTFQCQLDSGALAACGSSVDYSKLAFGDHTFTVWALDVAGNRSAAANYGWTFLENKAFRITGSLTSQLYPGANLPLDLKLSNPYNFAIRVTGLAVQVSGPAPTSTTACRADVTASGITAGLALDIPANQSRQLSSFASMTSWPAGWPRVAMANTDQNQDACKGTTFTLSYSGTATKS